MKIITKKLFNAENKNYLKYLIILQKYLFKFQGFFFKNYKFKI